MNHFGKPAFGVVDHGPELEQREWSAVQPGTALPEKDRALAVTFDQVRRDDPQRCAKHYGGKGDDDVDYTFGAVVKGTGSRQCEPGLLCQIELHLVWSGS
jgi:hypothetical protein